MNKIILGTLFGDEGKGATVQYLCKEELKYGVVPLVVRFSGGPQAGHRVLHKGIDHVCSLTGSGVLLGCPTYLHKDVMIDPISLMKEVESLNKFGIQPTIYINPYCRVIVPDDIYRNQINAKTLKDGTCGCGIFECFDRNRKHPDVLDNITSATAAPKEYLNFVGNTANNDEFIKACKWINSNCGIRLLEEISELYYSIIFEGSQGLLLDMDNGFMPNCTPSKVGLNGIPEEFLENAEVYLVMRSYLTRHGNGYEPIGEVFVREHFTGLEEPTNLDTGYQGKFKLGLLDLDLVNRAIDRHCLDNYQRVYNVKYNLVITHMDCSIYPDTLPAFFSDRVDYIDIDRVIKYCSKYINISNTYLGLGPESEIYPYQR